ncbi:MAG: SDR family NAD(P)-dependent oxidoreductase [Pseudomonadota bacterium]
MARTALITGASSGIGAELARIHAAKGGDLVLVARRKDRLEALRDEIGVNVLVLAEDLTDAAAPARIHAAVAEAGMTVEYLINNAGFGGRGKFHEMPWEDILSMVQVNAIALAGMMRKFLPDLVAKGSGRILNVTSTAAEASGPLQASYFASKAFAANLSNALVEELTDTNVTVTNFMPTATESEFAERAGMTNSRLFRNTTSARKVAQDGYDAMLRGDMDAYGGMSTKRWVMQQTLKYLPKRMALRAVRNAQEAA